MPAAPNFTRGKCVHFLASLWNCSSASPPPELIALNLTDGRVLWKQPLPAAPVPWGIAVNREGRVIVTLEGGRVVCFG